MTRTVDTLTRLRFREITPRDFGEISRYMALTDSRTCDYTLGGIVLWAKHFNYCMAEADDTLFIRGGREDDLSVTAFALPLGGSDFGHALELLRAYTGGGEVWFSAIPEDRLHLFATEPSATVSELGREWSDYLYDLHALAELSGGAMKKKRNHVNRFLTDYPEARLRDFTPELLSECLALTEKCGHDSTPTGVSEFAAVKEMLEHWDDYSRWFTGMALTVGNAVAGFTVGEQKNDTLHIHVERANHLFAGANEALASMFAREMLGRYPRLTYANRQDDAGDEGLRLSKESWHPLRLLPKFNVRLT